MAVWLQVKVRYELLWDKGVYDWVERITSQVLGIELWSKCCLSGRDGVSVR